MRLSVPNSYNAHWLEMPCLMLESSRLRDFIGIPAVLDGAWCLIPLDT